MSDLRHQPRHSDWCRCYGCRLWHAENEVGYWRERAEELEDERDMLADEVACEQFRADMSQEIIDLYES